MSSDLPGDPSDVPSALRGGDDDAYERELIRRAVHDRDPAALAELLVGAHDRLLVYIRRRLPIDLERHVDPEDILHDTFATAFQQVGSVRSENRAAFHSWLTTIAHNRLRNVAKAKRTLKRGGGGGGARGETAAGPRGAPIDADLIAADLLEMLARTSQSPRSVAGNREYLAMMRQAIAEMDDDDRAVLQLRFVEDLPHAQIADQMGRTEAAVRQLCLRAVRRLRELLPAISRND